MGMVSLLQFLFIYTLLHFRQNTILQRAKPRDAIWSLYTSQWYTIHMLTMLFICILFIICVH